MFPDIKANITINTKAKIAPKAAIIGANLGRHETNVIHKRPNPIVIIKMQNIVFLNPELSHAFVINELDKKISLRDESLGTQAYELKI